MHVCIIIYIYVYVVYVYVFVYAYMYCMCVYCKSFFFFFLLLYLNIRMVFIKLLYESLPNKNSKRLHLLIDYYGITKKIMIIIMIQH